VAKNSELPKTAGCQKRRVAKNGGLPKTAEEEAVAREVHATHARIVSGPDPEPMQEGPLAGSNQGRSAKRRRLESAASGSAQPPSKDDHQSSKKPRESDASDASKQHPDH
ncbi:hypothetical protein Tco_0470455, partial [Tanacetum coccineum]